MVEVISIACIWADEIVVVLSPWLEHVHDTCQQNPTLIFHSGFYELLLSQCTTYVIWQQTCHKPHAPACLPPVCKMHLEHYSNMNAKTGSKNLPEAHTFEVLDPLFAKQLACAVDVNAQTQTRTSPNQSVYMYKRSKLGGFRVLELILACTKLFENVCSTWKAKLRPRT